MRGLRPHIPAALVLAALLGPDDRAAAAPGDGWSPQYAEALRRTAERRRGRRKGEGQGAVGKIVPYPMPPALIIRHTPEAHDEVRDFLRLLRGG